MPPRILMTIVMLLLGAAPAFAECRDDACGAVEKILQARSANFAKLKGKPGPDPRGDPAWEGTQPIAGLIRSCYIRKHGEGSRYEYHCEASGREKTAELSREKAKQIGEKMKAAIDAADPKIVWFDDPAARALAEIEGYAGTEGWYGGYSKKQIMLKVEIVVSQIVGHTASVTVFAKPLARPDLR